MNTKKPLLALVGLATLGASAFGQTTNIYVTPDEEGIHFRSRSEEFTDFQEFIPLAAPGDMTNGYKGTEDWIWMSFIRFGVGTHLLESQADPAIPFAELENASSIVLRTGVTAKEFGPIIDEENGGVFGDFWLVPDHHTVVGNELDPLKNIVAWDIPNHPDAYYVQAFDPTQYMMMPNGRDATLDEFNLDVDITAAVKQAIEDGKLTANSTAFSIAFFPNEVDYYDELSGTYILDADYAPKRILGLKGRPNNGDAAQLEITTGGAPTTWNGYDIDPNGWVDTGTWMGMVNVLNDPWIYVADLGKYAYINGDSGWVYVPN